MKKSILAAIALISAISSQAQVSKGGLPLSATKEIPYENIPVVVCTNPDWAAQLRREQENTKVIRPVTVALFSKADFGFPQSGQFVHLDNGEKVWRGKISVPGAPAIGLLYDQFKLPKGVKLFLSNDNHQQVIGAFDADNNDASATFVNDAIQGSIVHVELNIAPQVNMNEIKLHINNAAVFHRAIEHLKVYSGVNTLFANLYDSSLNGSSSKCMINAICPQGANYSNSRKASVQILFIKGAAFDACSGTLMNATGNTPANCKAYLLTATHCDLSNATSSDSFNQSIVRFNFEHSTCAGSTNPPTAQSMTGLNFASRADYPTDGLPPGADFMLFSLRAPIPANYGAVLSGWNKSATTTTPLTEPKKFIGFHHPIGDVKKLSYSYQMGSSSDPLYWFLNLENSYSSPGSSGSGLFDADGYLIGDLSAGGGSGPDSCNTSVNGYPTITGTAISYSKFSAGWDYTLDGNAANRKLKPWLDPAGTNVTTLAPLTGTCSAITPSSVLKADDDLAAALSFFPNPAKDGTLSIQYNLKSGQNLSLLIMDVTGKTVLESNLGKVQSGSTTMNVQALTSGMYFVKFITETGFATKKLMIQK